MAKKSTTFSESNVNISANTSSLTINIYFSAQNSTTWFDSASLSCTCNGVTQRKSVHLARGGSVNASFTFNNIAHNSDGTKSVSWNWSCATGTSVLGTQSASGTKTLTTIPHSSSFSVTNAIIGDVATISINRANTNFTHTLSYSFGSLSGTIATNVETFTTWEISEDFYYEEILANSKTGKAKITCVTYNGSTKIGETTKEVTISCNESECIPDLGGSIYDVNEKTIALTGYAQTLIKYASTARVEPMASPKNGATMKSITVDGTLVDGNYLDIEKVNRNSFVVIATDSRGISKTMNVTVDMVDYIKLSGYANAVRTSPTSDKINIEYSGNFFNGNFGIVDNELQLQFRAVEDGQNIEEAEWNDVTPTITENAYEAKITVSNYDYRKKYFFQFKIVDKIDEPIISNLLIFKGEPVAYFTKNSFNVLGDLFISGDVHFLKHLELRHDGEGEFGEIYIDESIDSSADKFPCIILSDGLSHISNQVKLSSRDLEINGKSVKESMIEERGSNSYGEYIKYSNGDMICLGFFSKSINFTTTWGALYNAEISNVATFPAEFKSIDNWQVTPVNKGNATYSSIVNRVGCDTSGITLLAVARPSEGRSITCGFNYIAFGKWK